MSARKQSVALGFLRHGTLSPFSLQSLPDHGKISTEIWSSNLGLTSTKSHPKLKNKQNKQAARSISGDCRCRERKRDCVNSVICSWIMWMNWISYPSRNAEDHCGWHYHDYFTMFTWCLTIPADWLLFNQRKLLGRSRRWVKCFLTDGFWIWECFKGKGNVKHQAPQTILCTDLVFYSQSFLACEQFDIGILSQNMRKHWDSSMSRGLLSTAFTWTKCPFATMYNPD